MFTRVSDVNILGAFFPAWLLSVAGGILCSLALHSVFVRAGLVRYMGPPALIYPCLVILLSLGIWLVVFSG